MSELTRKKLPDDYVNPDGLCSECHYYSKDDGACSRPVMQEDCVDKDGEYIFIKQPVKGYR